MRRSLLLAAILSLAAAVVSTAPSAKQFRVAILPPGIESPFHAQIAKGAQEQGEGLGYRVEVQATESERDFAGQVRIMQRFIAKKVDAISVNAIDDRTVIAGVRKANAAGIPVFVHNSLTPVPGVRVAEYIGYNQRNGGRACGEYAAKLLKGRGEVFILDGIPGFHQIERSGGFLDSLRRYPGIRVVGREIADWEREKAIAKATEALLAHPEIDLFFCDSDEMAIGASIAARGLGKKVYTIGIDGNPVTLDQIAAGNITATLGVYPDKIGAQIILQMRKLFRGERIPPYLETSAVVIDRRNLEDYKAGKLWTPPRAGEAEPLPADAGTMR